MAFAIITMLSFLFFYIYLSKLSLLMIFGNKTTGYQRLGISLLKLFQLTCLILYLLKIHKDQQPIPWIVAICLIETKIKMRSWF